MQIGVLSTVDENAAPSGVGVLLIVLNGDTPCVNLAKDSLEFQNLSARPAIALTIFNTTETSALQIWGEAFIVTDENMRTEFKRRHMEILPDIDLGWQASDPVEIVGFKITRARLTEYAGNNILDKKVSEI